MQLQRTYDIELDTRLSTKPPDRLPSPHTALSGRWLAGLPPELVPETSRARSTGTKFSSGPAHDSA